VGPRSHRLRSIPNLPSRIASNVEAWRIEAWFRTIEGLHGDDIADRMWAIHAGHQGRLQWLSMKRSRYRENPAKGFLMTADVARSALPRAPLLEVLQGCTQVQINNNTNWDVVAPGRVVQPQPRTWNPAVDGPWEPITWNLPHDRYVLRPQDRRAVVIAIHASLVIEVSDELRSIHDLSSEVCDMIGVGRKGCAEATKDANIADAGAAEQRFFANASLSIDPASFQQNAPPMQPLPSSLPVPQLPDQPSGPPMGPAPSLPAVQAPVLTGQDREQPQPRVPGHNIPGTSSRAAHGTDPEAGPSNASRTPISRQVPPIQSRQVTNPANDHTNNGLREDPGQLGERPASDGDRSPGAGGSSGGPPASPNILLTPGERRRPGISATEISSWSVYDRTGQEHDDGHADGGEDAHMTMDSPPNPDEHMGSDTDMDAPMTDGNASLDLPDEMRIDSGQIESRDQQVSLDDGFAAIDSFNWGNETAGESRSPDDTAATSTGNAPPPINQPEAEGSAPSDAPDALADPAPDWNDDDVFNQMLRNM
jgi:hypothetical protein